MINRKIDLREWSEREAEQYAHLWREWVEAIGVDPARVPLQGWVHVDDESNTVCLEVCDDDAEPVSNRTARRVEVVRVGKPVPPFPVMPPPDPEPVTRNLVEQARVEPC